MTSAENVSGTRCILHAQATQPLIGMLAISFSSGRLRTREENLLEYGCLMMPSICEVLLLLIQVAAHQNAVRVGSGTDSPTVGHFSSDRNLRLSETRSY